MLTFVSDSPWAEGEVSEERSQRMTNGLPVTLAGSDTNVISFSGYLIVMIIRFNYVPSSMDSVCVLEYI